MIQGCIALCSDPTLPHFHSLLAVAAREGAQPFQPPPKGEDAWLWLDCIHVCTLLGKPAGRSWQAAHCAPPPHAQQLILVPSPSPACCAQQYFKHLYGDEDAGNAEPEPAVPAVPKTHRVQQVAPVEDAMPQRGADRMAEAAAPEAAAPAAAAAAGGAPPPTSPALVRDAPQACSSGSLAGAVPPALPSPAFRSSLRARSAHGELGSSGALHRMDDLSSQSPHSSFGDLASENSEPSMRR